MPEFPRKHQPRTLVELRLSVPWASDRSDDRWLPLSVAKERRHARLRTITAADRPEQRADGDDWRSDPGDHFADGGRDGHAARGDVALR